MIKTMMIQHSSGYWTEEKIILELKSIIPKFTYFPLISELIDMNRHDLANAINRNGGIKKYRSLMGYPIEKRDDGYWTEENIIFELKEIITKIGHFPTQRELYDIASNFINISLIYPQIILKSLSPQPL